MHPADIAFVLERLPTDERLELWALVDAARRGGVLLELADGVRDSLIAAMPQREIVDAAEHLDTDEIAYLVPSLPQDTVAALLSSLDQRERAQGARDARLPRRHRGRADGHRDGHGARRRRDRGRAALPAPPRGIARPLRPGLRGRPRRGAGRHPAPEGPADPRSRSPGRRGDAARAADLQHARPGQRRGRGVRALRPGVGAGGEPASRSTACCTSRR